MTSGFLGVVVRGAGSGGLRVFFFFGLPVIGWVLGKCYVIGWLV